MTATSTDYLGLLRPGTYLIAADGPRPLPSPLAYYLLAYLVLEARPIDRRRLAGLFWPDAEPSRALHSLSQQIYRLRHSLPQGSLAVTTNSVAANISAVTADVLLMLDGLSGNTVVDRAGLYECDFLSDAVFANEELVAWCEGWRARARIAAVDLLTKELDARLSASDWPAALEITRKQLAIAPFHEDAAIKRAHALAASGNFSAATEFLQQFRGNFKSVLDTEPTLPAPGDLITPVASTPPRRSETIPFIGRQAEFKRIRDGVNNASISHLHSILLTGPPGSGKTRLGMQALRWATIKGFTSVYVDCRYSERLQPFGSLSRFLEIIGHKQVIGGGSTVDEVADTIQEITQARPLAACFDDVQWMDASSCDVLGILADRLRLAPVLLLLTARSSELTNSSPSAWRWVSDDVHLAGLSSDEIALLISMYDSGVSEQLNKQQRQWLQEGLGGNPFFIIETLKYFRSAANKENPVPLPPTIRRVLRGQINSLRRHSRRLLSCAAVFGTHASANEVFHSARLSSWKLMDAVDELTSTGLITFTDNHISIRHDLIREAIYGGTPPHIRQMIHAEAAHALEYSGQTRATEAVRHQYLARNFTKAFSTALTAAAAASATGGFAEAECFLRLALRTADTPDQKIKANRAYLSYLCEQRRFVEAARPAHALRRYGCEGHDIHLAGSLARCAAHLQRASRPITEIGARVEYIAQAASRHRIAPRFRDAVILLAEVAQHDGQFKRSQFWADRFIATMTDDADYVVEITGLAATLSALAGEDRSKALCIQTVVDAEASGKARLIALAKSYSASAHMMLGDVDGAMADYETSIAYAERAGMRDVLFVTEGNSAVAFIEKGDFQEARTRLERCLRYARRVHAFQYANLAILGVESGDWVLARQSANTLLEAYGSYRVPWIPVVAHTALGLSDLNVGDVSAASKHVVVVDGLISSAGSALSDRSYAEILLSRYRQHNNAIHVALDGLQTSQIQLSRSQPIASLRLRLEIARLQHDCGECDRPFIEQIVADATRRGATLIASRAHSLLAN